jgi:hypothetical protein
MVWTQLIYIHFIIFSLNTKQLLAQNTPFLDYTSLPSPWELLDGFTEPFFGDVAIPIMDSHLFSFIAPFEDPVPS